MSVYLDQYHFNNMDLVLRKLFFMNVKEWTKFSKRMKIWMQVKLKFTIESLKVVIILMYKCSDLSLIYRS